ncbi:hypothetical protein D3C76_1072650 [compost metagenome]
MAGVLVVVAANAGVVAADQRVGAAVVLHDQGVQYRFTRAREDIGDPQRRKNGPVLRVVGVQHVAVGQHAVFVTHVFPFGHFHQGLQEQAIDAFQRVAVDVFMPSVQRVGARDESGH